MASRPTGSVVRLAAAASAILLLAAACTTGSGASTAPSTAAPAGSTASAAPVASPASAKPGGGKYGSGDDTGDEYGSGATSTPAASKTAGAEVHEVGVASGADGDHLTGAGGRTLYVFGNDSANTSTCEAACTTTWPPFTIAADDQLKAGAGVTGKLTTFARSDGSMQVAYDGSPLYYYAADKAAGDTNGQGVGDVWFIAQP